MGRPKSKPSSEQCELAKNLSLLGATNEKIAELCGISTTTFDKWMKDYPEFTGAVRDGRDKANAKAVRSLFERACGYETIERTYETEVLYNKDGEPLLDEKGEVRVAKVLKKEVHKHIAADVPAIKFFLWNKTKTLDPEDQWSDKQNIDLSSSDGSMSPKEPVINEGMNAVEAMAAYAQLIKDTQK